MAQVKEGRMRSINFSCLGWKALPCIFLSTFAHRGRCTKNLFVKVGNYEATLCVEAAFCTLWLTFSTFCVRRTSSTTITLWLNVFYIFSDKIFSLSLFTLSYCRPFSLFLELVITRCVGEDGKSTGLSSLIDSKEIC